jgi:hypothetical protein
MPPLSACAACACSTRRAVSGNFLVVALWAVKDLEYEAINWVADGRSFGPRPETGH